MASRHQSILIVGLLVAACTEHEPASLSLAEQADAATPSPIAIVPGSARDQVRVVEDVIQKVIDLEPAVDHPELRVIAPHDEVDLEYCAFEVEAVGLPAVDEDGDRLALIEDDASAGEEVMLGSDFVLTNLVDPERSERRRLVEDETERVQGASVVEPPTVKQCRAYERRIRARVARINEELSAFRPLQELDVYFDDPFEYEDDVASDVLPATAVPVQDRPVEVLYRGGWFTMRVAGLRVLTRQAKEHWRVADDFCDTTPHFVAVYGDRATGVGVAQMSHQSGGCLCDGDVVSHPIEVPAEAFGELERRSSARYVELLQAKREEIYDAEA